MRKAVKHGVIGPKRTIYSPDKVAVVINGRETSFGPQHGVWAKLEPPRIIINVAEERCRLSLWPAVAWLRDKLQRLARRLGLIRVSPEPCHSHTLRAGEEPPLMKRVYAPAKQKSQYKPRKRKRQMAQSRINKHKTKVS
jgi:hypothetical protein